MFQFINWAFAEKEKDGYYKYIGSRMDGGEAISIATKENNSFPKSMITDPPGRNNALIWQIRTLIQQGTLPEAGALIAMLKNDPAFPKRLYPALEEVQALWFYNQEMWDSSAHHLIKALPVTKNKQEEARWEFLAAQMFEKAGHHELAREYYAKAIKSTTDPLLEVYARLFMIRSNKEGGDDYINNNINALLSAAKKDKYRDYRDVIYSMAAQMELERGNLPAAQLLLYKASQFKNPDAPAGKQAYLKLADLAFDRGQYVEAAAFYDSVVVQDLPTKDAERITERKDILTRLVAQLNTVKRQDSLQGLAGMPEAVRSEAVRKTLRQLRKEQGLKDEDIPVSQPSAAPGDPFNAETKGEWYFYNKSLKTTGAASFRQVWGTRPNVDNWRRFSDVTAQLKTNIPSTTDRAADAKPNDPADPLTFEALIAKLPLTPDRMQASNDSIQMALFALGLIYMNDLENYASAIETFNELRRRFPAPAREDELLFNLFYSYTRAGNAAKANEIKALLLQKYPNSRFAAIVATGKDPMAAGPDANTTASYERIYDMFIEGKFEEAIAAKKIADSTYKTNYWSPQLLYIEAVYHIRQRNDSTAIQLLQTILAQNGGTPMATKASNLIDVVRRRAQIEDELAKLQIERPKEDSFYVEPSPITPVIQEKQSVINRPKDSVVTKPMVLNKPVTDTTTRKPVNTATDAKFSFNANSPHFVTMILTNVDVVYVNEARNALLRHVRERYAGQGLDVTSFVLNDNTRVLQIGNFATALTAIEFVQAVKPLSSQIVPWLKSDKYYYSIISPENLQVVKEMKDFTSYNQFLERNLPVKF
jgi:outer membrane protein assembly factor BamD (BamD/ComL family)